MRPQCVTSPNHRVLAALLWQVGRFHHTTDSCRRSILCRLSIMCAFAANTPTRDGFRAPSSLLRNGEQRHQTLIEPAVSCQTGRCGSALPCVILLAVSGATVLSAQYLTFITAVQRPVRQPSRPGAQWSLPGSYFSHKRTHGAFVYPRLLCITPLSDSSSFRNAAWTWSPQKGARSNYPTPHSPFSVPVHFPTNARPSRQAWLACPALQASERIQTRSHVATIQYDSKRTRIEGTSCCWSLEMYHTPHSVKSRFDRAREDLSWGLSAICNGS